MHCWSGSSNSALPEFGIHLFCANPVNDNIRPPHVFSPWSSVPYSPNVNTVKNGTPFASFLSCFATSSILSPIPSCYPSSNGRK